MADAPTQNKPPEAPVKREAETGSNRLVRTWDETIRNIGAFFGNKEAEKAKEFHNAKKPGDFILDNLAKDPAFQSPEYKKQIATIRSDTKLMGALNKAITGDPAVREALMEQRGNIGGLSPAQLINGLQNEDNRRVLTNALNKVAEKPGDEFGMGYLNDIAKAGQKTDFVKLDELLEEGNIGDPKVKAGARLQKSGLGGLNGIMDFLRDPDKAIKDWTNDPNGPLAGLSEENKNAMAGLLNMLAKMMNAFTPGGGFSDPYIQLAGRIGDRLKVDGARVRGHGIVDAEVGPPRPTAAVPGADNTQTAGATVGDRGNAKVADNQRATAAFNTVSAGTPAQVAQVNAPAANDPIFRQTGTGGPGVGPA